MVLFIHFAVVLFHIYVAEGEAIWLWHYGSVENLLYKPVMDFRSAKSTVIYIKPIGIVPKMSYLGCEESQHKCLHLQELLVIFWVCCILFYCLFCMI